MRLGEEFCNTPTKCISLLMHIMLTQEKKINRLVQSPRCHSTITFRFLTTSIEGVKVGEELCETPTKCLTILITDSQDTKSEILKLQAPDFLVNILEVGLSVFVFKKKIYIIELCLKIR